MAKLIKKSKCKFEAGHIVKKDKIVGIPTRVWLQLNKLEVMLQQYKYLKDQPAYNAGPTLEGFERISVMDINRPYVDLPDTPIMDKKVEEAMAFMVEADKVSNAAEINSAIDNFGALIDWCTADKFIEGDYFGEIDTFMLGNPLYLRANDVVDALRLIVESPIVVED